MQPTDVSPPAAGRASTRSGTRPAAGKLIALDRADVLCIRNGRGTRVRAVSGVLWVTEEDGSKDHVLLPGDAIDLARMGTAIVSAERPARIVIEVPAGAASPRTVEMTRANGERRRIALAAPALLPLSTIAARIATLVGNALASMRTIVTTIGPDGHLPRGMRRRATRGTRRVERVVIDHWMLWRR